MAICKNCGVELEDNIQICPLCGQHLHAHKIKEPTFRQPLLYNKRMTAPQKKFTWEIISLILLSAIAATFIINFIINKSITWSEYPVAVSLIIFSYISVFSFWQQRTTTQMMVGFVLASVCMLTLDAITSGIDWSLKLGVPLLLAVNLIAAGFLVIIDISRYKGINLLAWAFLCAALLCMAIEGILSYYQTKTTHLTWSVIVGGCTIPVVLVLLFVHFRLRKGRSLEKTFHI